MEQIQNIVSILADNYGFDEDEALEYVLTVKREKSPAYARAIKAIENTKEKISELEQKIAGKKVRDVEKSREKLKEMREKLESQEEKLDDIGKPKEAKPRAPKAKKEDAGSKHISRMSPTLTEKLKETFTEFGTEMTDKTRKQFVAYVNELTSDDFAARTLTEHMRDYVIMTVRPSEEKDAESVDLSELKNLIDGYSAGIYWDAIGKRFVTGKSDDDEDIVELQFKSKTFMVGETTGRVYENIDDEDVFVGYKGIGQFMGM
jgi:superfamily II RNA helicase